MDLGSVAGNVNGSPSLKELRGSKQDRSGFDGEDCLQQSTKLARTTLTIAEDKHLPSAAYSRPMLFHQGIPLTRSASLLSSDSRRQEHMLSFSDKPEAYDFTKYVGLDSNKNSLSPFLHQLPPPYCRSSGGTFLFLNNLFVKQKHGFGFRLDLVKWVYVKTVKSFESFSFVVWNGGRRRIWFWWNDEHARERAFHIDSMG